MANDNSPEDFKHLPDGAPWLSDKKVLLRNPYRFRAVVDPGMWSHAYLRDEDISERSGDRPITYDDAPHQMYTQQATPEVLEKLIRAAISFSEKVGTVAAGM